MKWQHTVPQRDLSHEPAPRPQESVTTRYNVVGGKRLGVGQCAVCGKGITLFGEYEGPESLKALFRF